MVPNHAPGHPTAVYQPDKMRFYAASSHSVCRCDPKAVYAPLVQAYVHRNLMNRRASDTAVSKYQHAPLSRIKIFQSFRSYFARKNCDVAARTLSALSSHTGDLRCIIDTAQLRNICFTSPLQIMRRAAIPYAHQISQDHSAYQLSPTRHSCRTMGR